MGSFPEREFKRRMRVNKCTFKYLCTLLGLVLKKKYTHFRESTSVECKVAIIMSRLATRNSLKIIGDIYDIGLSTTSIIVRECCEAIRIQLQPLVFSKPTLVRMKEIAFGFEALHNILFILEAIDGSHISILAPFHDPVAYSNIKEFYSCLLQGVVDADCKL